jgi:hypothetical protein
MAAAIATVSLLGPLRSRPRRVPTKCRLRQEGLVEPLLEPFRFGEKRGLLRRANGGSPLSTAPQYRKTAAPQHRNTVPVSQPEVYAQRAMAERTARTSSSTPIC